MLAEAGLSENPVSFAPIIGFLFAFALVGNYPSPNSVDMGANRLLKDG